MNIKKLCTVVINSCDQYEEAWYPFFELLKKYWPDRGMDIVLNTESKRYDQEGIDIQCINTQNAKSWSARLINVLLQLNTKYVILLLEDFFLQSFVKQREIEHCIEYMEEDPQIAVFYFKHITGYDIASKYSYYNEMNPGKKYILNCQAALWNREALLELLDPYESPWDMEERAHLRLKGTQKKFYCSSIGTYKESKKNTFDYLWALEAGYGICKSKWLWNNQKLFKKNNIAVKYTMLSQMTYGQYLMQKLRNFIGHRKNR